MTSKLPSSPVFFLIFSFSQNCLIETQGIFFRFLRNQNAFNDMLATIGNTFIYSPTLLIKLYILTGTLIFSIAGWFFKHVALWGAGTVIRILLHSQNRE